MSCDPAYSSALEREAAELERLKNLGVQCIGAIQMNAHVFAYPFLATTQKGDTPTNKIGTVFFVVKNEDGSIKKIDVAFTSGSLYAQGNFEPSRNAFITENLAFAAGKVCVELYTMKKLLEKPAEELKDSLETMVKVAREDKAQYEALLSGVDTMSEEDKVKLAHELLLKDIQKYFFNTDKLVIDLNEKTEAKIKKGDSPVSDSVANEKIVKICEARQETMKEWVQKNQDANAHVWFQKYYDNKMELLQFVPGANPKIGKLCLGQGAIFHYFVKVWEGEMNLAIKLVEFVRTFMYRAEENLAYGFFQASAHGMSKEISFFDNIWADKVSVVSGGPLCCFKLTEHEKVIAKDDYGVLRVELYDIERAEKRQKVESNQLACRQTILDLFTKGAKKLTIANDGVLRKMKNAIDGIFPEKTAEDKMAEDYVRDCGFEAWFNKHATKKADCKTLFCEDSTMFSRKLCKDLEEAVPKYAFMNIEKMACKLRKAF